MSTAQVLPKELRLSAPPTMPQARSYLFKQQSTQSTYDSSQQVVQINLPRLQRSYLTKDSYLSFRMNLPAATVMTDPTLDTCGAFGVIDKIEIYDYLGSTLLESTSGHGQLMTLLMDLDCSVTEIGTHFNTISGTKDSLTGSALGATTTGASAAQSFEFAIPLFSFLGMLSNKFVPLHNGFTIMLTLNPTSVYAGFTTENVSFTISNVYMNCQILELGPTAESMLMSSSAGQPLVIPAKAYRNYKSAITTGMQDFRLDLNLNVASLTNVLWMMRDSTTVNITPQLKKTLSYRIRNGLKSWYFQYGSSILPQTSGIQCRPRDGTLVANGGCDEAYIELLKSRHGLNSDYFNTQINKANYQIDTIDTNGDLLKPGTTKPVGRFAAGLDLELVPGRSQSLVCGMNTNGMNTSIFATFDSATSKAAIVDAWCEYDAFINISPGIATTVSF